MELAIINSCLHGVLLVSLEVSSESSSEELEIWLASTARVMACLIGWLRASRVCVLKAYLRREALSLTAGGGRAASTSRGIIGVVRNAPKIFLRPRFFFFFFFFFYSLRAWSLRLWHSYPIYINPLPRHDNMYQLVANNKRDTALKLTSALICCCPGTKKGK